MKAEIAQQRHIGAIHERNRTLQILVKYREQNSKVASAIYDELIEVGITDVVAQAEARIRENEVAEAEKTL